MKKFVLYFLSILLFNNFFLVSQDVSVFNQFKYIYVKTVQYESAKKDYYRISSRVSEKLKKYGFKVITDYDAFPDDYKKNPCLAVTCFPSHPASSHSYGSKVTVNLTFKDCQDNIIYSSSGSYSMGDNVWGSFKWASRKALKFFDGFRYKYNPTLNSFKLITEDESQQYEKEIRAYLDSASLSPIEGIFDYAGTDDNEYRLVIIKEGYKYVARILESNVPGFNLKDKKAILEAAAFDGAYTLKWTMGNKNDVKKTLANYNNGVFEFTIPGNEKPSFLYKLYPTIRDNDISSSKESGKWRGNGSGFFISNSGYIVTNHHVIDKISEIEVEFKYNNEIVGFNAIVIQTDPTNDLAILKIEDEEFNGITDIPYNFKTRSADVGSDVFALGYPKALSIMGKEIKFTDGRISAKTGYKGDITTYQSTTPIQPGSSGGPLFDFKGNLIGVNNAKIVSEDVEGVSYTIKSSYLLNLIDVLPESISLPSSNNLTSKSLTEQVKILSDYVVLIKVK